MPVLGYDTAGALNWGSSGLKMGCGADSDEIGGNMVTFHIAVQARTSPAMVKIGVYNADQSTGSPLNKTLIEQVELEVDVSDDESVAASEGNALEASTKYFVVFAMDSTDTKVKYDWGEYGWYGDSVYANEFLSPWEVDVYFMARIQSVWVDYQHPGVLGYDTPGSSQTGSNTRCYGDSHIAIGSSGNLTTFHCAVGQVDGTPAYRGIKLAVYDCQQSDGDPTGYSPVEQVEFFVEVSDDESVAAPEGNSISASTKYWLAFTPYSSINRVKYDSTGGEGHWYNYTDYANEFLDPRSGTHNTWALLFSIWVDYEAGPSILGYDTPGTSNWGSAVHKIGTHDVTDAQGGNITTFHVAIAAIAVGEAYRGVKLAVYDSKQDDPNKGNPAGCALIEQVLIDPVIVSDDNSIAAPEGNLLAADTRYWLGHICEDAANKIKYDTGDTYDSYYKSGMTYPPEFVDPFQSPISANTARLISIWVDYGEAGGEEFIRSISNTIGITDVLSKSATFIKSIADIINGSDTLNRSATFPRIITDDISITSIVSKVGTFVRTIADNIGITDVISRVRTFIRAIVDSVGVTDVISRVGTFVRAIADDIDITSVISRVGTFIRSIADQISIGSISSTIATLYRPRVKITNPYDIADRNLLRTFHRESPDFDLMNSVNAELHKVAASYCRLYKLDIIQSTKDNDDVYPELEYRTYLPPVRIKMYFVTPTWTEALSRLGINMPEEIVFSANLQDLIERIREIKAIASKAKAGLKIRYEWTNNNDEPTIVYFYCDEDKLYSHLRMDDGQVIPDSNFELNILNQAGTIDLHHPAVNTVEKLTDFINNRTNYIASYSGNGSILSSKAVAFSGSIGNYNNWINIKDNEFMLIFDRATGVYDNVSDVVESGDIIETFRRHADTRNAVERNIPIHDPVTLQPVRGKLYEVQFAMPTSITSTRHYVNYNITADKIAMDVYDKLLDKLPADENFVVGSDRWYA